MSFLVHFYVKFFKRFQIFEIFRKPHALGARNPTFGGGDKLKIGTPQPRGKKFGGRHLEIAELRPSTVVVISHWIKVKADQVNES